MALFYVPLPPLQQACGGEGRSPREGRLLQARFQASAQVKSSNSLLLKQVCGQAQTRGWGNRLLYSENNCKVTGQRGCVSHSLEERQGPHLCAPVPPGSAVGLVHSNCSANICMSEEPSWLSSWRKENDSVPLGSQSLSPSPIPEVGPKEQLPHSA